MVRGAIYNTNNRNVAQELQWYEVLYTTLIIGTRTRVTVVHGAIYKTNNRNTHKLQWPVVLYTTLQECIELQCKKI